jgi:uncharacterized membrane protein YeiH
MRVLPLRTLMSARIASPVICCRVLSVPVRHVTNSKFSAGVATSAGTSPVAPVAKLDPLDLKLESLPRYPNLSTGGALRLMDYIGTASFAYSSAIAAASCGMDLMGTVMIGTITSVGGGTIRDMIILGYPRPFWTSETEYLYICFVFAALAFYAHRKLKGFAKSAEEQILLFTDTFGLGAFCVIGAGRASFPPIVSDSVADVTWFTGAMNGLRNGLPLVVTAICALSTACFGGVVRDVLRQKPPRIFYSHAELYGSTALAGAFVYLGARSLAVPLPLRVGAAVGCVASLRYLAWTHNLTLPVWDATETA